jgi:septum site-determining protein MinC
MGLFGHLPTQKPTPASRAKVRLQTLLEHERVEVSQDELSSPLATPERFSVSIQGRSDGLVLRVGDAAPWNVILRDMEDRLKQVNTRSFFQGAMLHLDAGNRSVTAKEIEELTALLAYYGVTLASVVDNSTLMQTYLSIRSAIPPPPRERAQLESLATWKTRNVLHQGVTGIVIRHPLKSGEILRHTETLVILGNIPSATEVVTSGDIIVLGRLRGVAHAGASGNEKAIIAALVLTPTQLRIGQHFLAGLNSPGAGRTIGELARVSDGHIVVEPWLK